LAQVHIYPQQRAMADAAAETATRLIRSAVEKTGMARVVAATGNSQMAFIESLVKHSEVPWPQVEIFHMDEYVGMSATHPASFRLWIKTRIAEKVPASQVHYLQGDSDDLGSEIERYTRLMMAGPIDVAFVGFGENGHIAFNDPPVADFNDPAVIKVVELDLACRLQQKGEGHFPTLQDVPLQALTLTCPALFRAAAWVSCVPELRKAKAVRDALEGPISAQCPASLVRKHSNAHVFLDSESASLLSQ
jgi:glucosamine-6-phosphate deaminase